MCGIFGVVAFDGERPDIDRLRRTTNLLRHRGPDGGGYWAEHGVYLGHRRLAIIDLDTGAQPMASADGRFVITFNGEIYNYPELREELRAAGARFQTHSDTEVILEGYAAWGTDIVRRLEGMFAFGLYDRRDGSLLLARDRFGEKPLLYASSARRVVFASELGPIAATLGPGGAVDEAALAGYLCLNYVPGERTMLRAVGRVAPGEWVTYDREGRCRRERYWSLREAIEPVVTTDREALLDELQRRLDEAVRLTLCSDVPVGLFLSGGTDSSVVAESAARQGTLASAFCVDVGEQGFSEWGGASFVARRLGIAIERVRFTADVLDEFLDVAAHLDDPLADSSALAVWTVARGAARHVKVVLSGDGGDELFGGYLTYPASRWHARLSAVVPPAVARALASISAHIPVDDRVKVGSGYKLHRFLRALPLSTAEAHFTWNGAWLPAEAATLVAPAIAPLAAGALRDLAARHALTGRAGLHALQLADATEYLPNDILAKVDRATMAHGLESRAPLLNARVAGFALGLPVAWRVGPVASTKRLLRALAARHYGDAHARAPKQGFSIPIHQWLRGAGRPLLTTLLAPERVAALGVLDQAAIARAAAAHLSGARSLGWELWGLMVLVAWHEQRVVAPPDPARLPEATDLAPVLAAAAGV